MIRKNEITFKLVQLKSFSDQSLFEHSVSSLDLSSCACPICGSIGNFTRLKPYERQMITVLENRRAEIPISVPRALCNACGHTQSFTSDNLIPFSSYTLRFVLTVLSDYLEHSRTVRNLCDFWQIAVSTLYIWIRLFSDHFSYWKRELDKIIRLSRDSIYQVMNITGFPHLFYETFGFSFLQRCGKLPSFRCRSSPRTGPPLQDNGNDSLP